MPPPLVAAFVEGLRSTVPFRSLPATGRPTEELWSAHNSVLLQLRLPLYHQRLGKPRPKEKVYEEAIRSGLGALATFASLIGTCQATVRIERGSREAISFQPRPFGANWTLVHCIQPVALQVDWTDPMLTYDDIDGRQTLTKAVSTRDIIHLAGKVALATAHLTEHTTFPSGTATYTFHGPDTCPRGQIVYRPLLAGLRHMSARTIVLAVPPT